MLVRMCALLIISFAGSLVSRLIVDWLVNVLGFVGNLGLDNGVVFGLVLGFRDVLRPVFGDVLGSVLGLGNVLGLVLGLGLVVSLVFGLSDVVLDLLGLGDVPRNILGYYLGFVLCLVLGLVHGGGYILGGEDSRVHGYLMANSHTLDGQLCSEDLYNINTQFGDEK